MKSICTCSEGSYLTDDSFSALLSLLIKNDYVSLSLQLLRDRYYSKNGETRPSLPYGVAFNSVKLLIRHGYYESLPPLFQVLMDLKWERQTAPLIKGMDMTNMPSTEYLGELNEQLWNVILRAFMNIYDKYVYIMACVCLISIPNI